MHAHGSFIIVLQYCGIDDPNLWIRGLVTDWEGKTILNFLAYYIPGSMHVYTPCNWLRHSWALDKHSTSYQTRPLIKVLLITTSSTYTINKKLPKLLRIISSHAIKQTFTRQPAVGFVLKSNYFHNIIDLKRTNNTCTPTATRFLTD